MMAHLVTRPSPTDTASSQTIFSPSLAHPIPHKSLSQMDLLLSDQLKELLLKAEQNEKDLKEARVQIADLEEQLASSQKSVEYWMKQAVKGLPENTARNSENNYPVPLKTKPEESRDDASTDREDANSLPFGKKLPESVSTFDMDDGSSFNTPVVTTGSESGTVMRANSPDCTSLGSARSASPATAPAAALPNRIPPSIRFGASNINKIPPAATYPAAAKDDADRDPVSRGSAKEIIDVLAATSSDDYESFGGRRGRSNSSDTGGLRKEEDSYTSFVNQHLDDLDVLYDEWSSDQAKAPALSPTYLKESTLDLKLLDEAIEELYELPGDLEGVLIMMDNILKTRKYRQTLWLRAAYHKPYVCGSWTEQRLMQRKAQGHPATLWHHDKWSPTTSADLRGFVAVLVELYDEFQQEHAEE